MNREDRFLEELEKRLDENKRLTDKRGMPEEWASVVAVLGTRPWQSLVVVSGAVTLVVCGLWFDEVVRVVERLLLV